MEHEADSVVIPLVPMLSDPTTEAMLRMLVNREAIVVSRVSDPGDGRPSGMLATTTGAFARALGQATGHMTRASSGRGLYRLVLPSGSVVRDLVPAVGGGFRGMVRSAGSTKLSGHARLVPATLGIGAAATAGPLIATVAIAATGEMLAQHQTNKKLDSIKNAVQGIKNHLAEEQRVVLTRADKEAQKVAGYLLDQAQLPAISGASHAFAALADLNDMVTNRLDRWIDAVAKHSAADRVNAAQLMSDLIGRSEDSIHEFERAVTQTYEALALRARVVVLEKIAAEFANPNRSLPHVEHILRSELSELGDRQSQLIGVLDDLSATQIDAGRTPIPIAGKHTISMRTSFGRLARALHATPDGLPFLTESDNTLLELAPTPDGLSVLTPAAT